MRSFIAKSRLIKILAAYLAISIVLMLLPSALVGPVRGVVVYPLLLIQRLTMRGALSLRRTAGRIVAAWGAGAEAERLRREVERLRSELAAERERRTAAERRLALLDRIPPPERRRTVISRVVSCDVSPLRRTAVLDKGSGHGIVRNAPVLLGDAVVGRVEEVAPWTCRVVLLGDPRCRLAARSARSRVQGVVEGIGDGLCKVKYVPITLDVAEGDVFITTGAEGIFPPGRVVGRCVEVSSEAGDVFKWILLKPMWDAATLEEVAVMLPAASDGGR